MARFIKDGLIFRSWKNYSRYCEKIIELMNSGEAFSVAKERAFWDAVFQKRVTLTPEKHQEVQELHKTHCYYCGKELPMTACQSCARTYCKEHIDPDDHKCVHILETESRIYPETQV